MKDASERISTSPLRVRVAPEQLEAQPEPVSMLVRLVTTPHVLLRGEAQLRPVPDVGRIGQASRDVLAAGGRFMLFDWETLLEDESLEFMHRWTSRGVYRLGFADLTLERANYEPRPGWRNQHSLGGSPDGEHVVVAQSWVDIPAGRAPAYGDQRVTVSLAGFSDAPAQELFTLVGGPTIDSDDLPIQWSPDGTRIAIGVSVFTGPESLPDQSVRILDAATGQEVTRVGGVRLAGSVSWSPDQTRLLVKEFWGHLRIHDLNADTRHEIPALPGRRPDPSTRGPARLLGFADDHDLLVATQRARTMTISAMDPTSGDRRPLIRWTGTDDMYPVLTAMPPGYWD